MTRFVSPEAAPAGKDWVYLGKDACRRATLAARLGPPRPLGNLVHTEARRLRGSFLDWCAVLGTGTDPEAWWAGTLAWKSWSASDLFLLCAYRAAAERLREEDTPIVVVEDPWLLELLGGPRARGRLHAALTGLGRRIKWLARTLLSLVRQRRLASSHPPPAPRDGAVLIYTHLLPRSLDGANRWKEFYLPGLIEELSEHGVPSVITTYPEPYGHEWSLAVRNGLIRPSLLDSRLRDVLAALFALPDSPRAVPPLAGTDVTLLVEREWWHDFSRGGRCNFVLFHRSMQRLLASVRWRAVVFPWESQPQERLLALAARKAGIATVGYQHSTVPSMQLPFFLAPGEETAWPDLILASGPAPLKALGEGGVPASRLRLGGARRYPHLTEEPRPLPPASAKDVLVLLPIDRDQTQHLLAALAAAYPKGGTGFSFVVKPHPAEPTPSPRFPCEMSSEPIERLLARCAVVVTCASTAGLEAAAAGRELVRFRPEALLDLDPCELLDEDSLPTAYDGELDEVLESVRSGRRRLDEKKARAAIRELFAPVDARSWRDALRY